MGQPPDVRTVGVHQIQFFFAIPIRSEQNLPSIGSLFLATSLGSEATQPDRDHCMSIEHAISFAYPIPAA
jgi:hypothetical protein